MSIAFDPNQTCPVWLAADHPLPPDKRPTFLARYLSGRELRRVRQMTKEAVAIQEDAEKFWALVDRILAALLAGWRNVVDRQGEPIDFRVETDAEGCPTLASAADALTDEERWDLVMGAQQAVSLSELDKKKFSAQSGLPAVIFANAAEMDRRAAANRAALSTPSVSPASDAKGTTPDAPSATGAASS